MTLAESSVPVGTLHLVRHGETTGNVMRRLDTALPGAGLTDFGARQAVRFGLTRPVDPARVVLYSSRARRARETASLIASVWGVPPGVLDGVHEVQAGDLEDRIDAAAYAEFRAVATSWHRGDLGARTPGGESAEEVIARYTADVAALRARHLDPGAPDPRSDVFVVSHGAAIRIVAANLAPVPSESAETQLLGNLDTIELVPAGPGWAIRSWGGRREGADIMG